MDNHDSAYRALFSHAVMVRDLLAGFVPEPWVDQLDMESLERVSGHYVTDDMRSRSSDVVWRVRWGGQWLYVYILLEFQSTDDHFMAVRLLNYISLLWQDMVRSDDLSEGRRLPPVCPIVLYNGEPRWCAPTSLEALFAPLPDGLHRWLPRFRYLLIDEGAYRYEELEGVKNLVAALFRLENSRSPEDVRGVLQFLLEWLNTPEQAGLRRNLTEWLRRVLLPRRMPDASIPQLQDLQEVHAMLAERVKTWTAEWLAQGRAEGREEGRRAEAELVLRQLTRRYGALSAVRQQQVLSASTADLARWAERLLDAPTLEQVFSED